VFKKAEVPFIDNGLRKSAISYWFKNAEGLATLVGGAIPV
jgi:hypothetical protein